MFKKTETSKINPDQSHTLISTSAELVGDIHFSGELIVEGRIKGNIYAEDESAAIIRVAKTGIIEGEICVPSVVINGTVSGDVRSIMHINSNQQDTKRLGSDRNAYTTNSNLSIE
jgi:cytoskeletal protein CcmA (bactofilin family)